MNFAKAVAILATIAALPACQMTQDLGSMLKPKNKEPGAPMSATRPAQDAAEQDTCGASDLAFMVGLRASEVTFDSSDPVRIIAPDSAVTMDHLPERLNVMTDKDGKITSLSCG